MFNSELVQHLSLPPNTLIEAGSPIKKNWLVRNSGNETWENCHLMLQDGNFRSAISHHPVPRTAPGETAVLSLELSAPAEVGVRTSRWQLFNAAGKPFGEPLLIELELTPRGDRNGLQVTSRTEGSGEADSIVTHTIVLYNTGGQRWRTNFSLAYVGGDATPVENSYPLPATIPGDRNEIQVQVVAPNTDKICSTYWQFRDSNNVSFGGLVSAEFQAIPRATPVMTFDPTKWRTVIWDITSVFESGRVGGNPAAFQNHDLGIVSFGKHQATLASGTLGRVLQIYCQKSNTAAANHLCTHYLQRTVAIDASLQHDAGYRQALINAASDPAMSEAQDDLFAERFYNPAVDVAKSLGITTPLGLATLYDTRVQHGGGGLNFLIGLTRDNFAPPPAENSQTREADWLAAFINEREALLNRLADKQDGKASQTSDANQKRMFEINAHSLRVSTFRPQTFRNLLQQNNLGLAGSFQVRTLTVQGL